jgi:hypothetical protein
MRWERGCGAGFVCYFFLAAGLEVLQGLDCGVHPRSPSCETTVAGVMVLFIRACKALLHGSVLLFALAKRSYKGRFNFRHMA